MYSDTDDLVSEFRSHSGSYFRQKVPYAKEKYHYIQNFFKYQNLKKAEWKDFQKLGEYLDVLGNPKRYNLVFGKPYHDIQHYRDVFYHLSHSLDKEFWIEYNIKDLKENEDYRLKYFDDDIILELVSYFLLENYPVFTSRNFYTLLSTEQKDIKLTENLGKDFLQFKTIVEKSFLWEAYWEEDDDDEYNPPHTDLPKYLEFSLFLDWVYEEERLKTSLKQNVNIWIFNINDEPPSIIHSSLWQQYLNKNQIYFESDFSDFSKDLGKEFRTHRRKKENREEVLPATNWKELNGFATKIHDDDIIIVRNKKGNRFLGWGIVSEGYNIDDYYIHIVKIDWKHHWSCNNYILKEDTKPWFRQLDKNKKDDIHLFNNIATQMSIPAQISSRDIISHDNVLNSDSIQLKNDNIEKRGVKYWWLNIIKEDKIAQKHIVNNETFYSAKGNWTNHIKSLKIGDLFIWAQSDDINCINRVTREWCKDFDGKGRFDFVIEKEFKIPILINELEKDKVLRLLKLLNDKDKKYDKLSSLNKTQFNQIHHLLKMKNPPPYSKREALEDLFIEEKTFNSIQQSLKRKKNIILQGPPGVGKTYVVERIAYSILKEKDTSKVSMVQFHQSYTYEDFIQGIRPTDKGHFDTKEGVFYRFCEKAKITPDKPHFFIIDEINRGNLSKIFGELMMLIEADKRGKKYAMPLTYSKRDETFYIPENVYIIGTMNTADRSLALVDYALRRRFAFISIEPNFDNAFKTFLQQNNVSSTLANHIASKMTSLNENIAQENTLGKDFKIGHSYFCDFPEDLNEENEKEWFEEVVEFEVKPLLEEYWFDKPNKVSEELSKLKYQPQG